MAAARLLAAGASSRVLASSRVPLGAEGEAVFALGPLRAADGIELFFERVRLARAEARISREDKARVKKRLRRFGELERDYGPEGVIVFDGITETVGAKGHTVHASTGGGFPPRLVRLLNLLSRLHDKYLAGAPEPSR